MNNQRELTIGMEKEGRRAEHGDKRVIAEVYMTKIYCMCAWKCQDVTKKESYKLEDSPEWKNTKPKFHTNFHSVWPNLCPHSCEQVLLFPS